MIEDYDPAYYVIEPHKIYFEGIDWGRSHDFSVNYIVSKDRRTGIYRIEYVREQHTPFEIQHSQLVEDDKLYNFRRVIPEKHGIGIAPSERLRLALGSKVKYFIPSPAEWFRVFTKLHDIADQGKFKIPASELKLIRQLRLLTFQVRAGKLTVRSEGKDDHAQALGIVMHGITSGSGMGVAGSL
jgi:hypothetical protein